MVGKLELLREAPQAAAARETPLVSAVAQEQDSSRCQQSHHDRKQPRSIYRLAVRRAAHGDSERGSRVVQLRERGERSRVGLRVRDEHFLARSNRPSLAETVQDELLNYSISV